MRIRLRPRDDDRQDDDRPVDEAAEPLPHRRAAQPARTRKARLLGHPLPAPTGAASALEPSGSSPSPDERAGRVPFQARDRGASRWIFLPPSQSTSKPSKRATGCAATSRRSRGAGSSTRSTRSEPTSSCVSRETTRSSSRRRSRSCTPFPRRVRRAFARRRSSPPTRAARSCRCRTRSTSARGATRSSGSRRIRRWKPRSGRRSGGTWRSSTRESPPTGSSPGSSARTCPTRKCCSPRRRGGIPLGCRRAVARGLGRPSRRCAGRRRALLPPR